MRVLGLDPGAKPGYCMGGAWPLWFGTSKPHPSFTFDLAVVEAQTVSQGVTHHKGERFRAHHKTVPTLAMTAGWQIAQVSATRRIAIEPKWWRGLLWDDGASGLYGLAAAAAIGRLRDDVGTAVSDDEVEAYGLMRAGLAIGFAQAGTLKDGRPWKLKPQVWGYSLEVETPKKKARKFVRDLLAKQRNP